MQASINHVCYKENLELFFWVEVNNLEALWPNACGAWIPDRAVWVRALAGIIALYFLSKTLYSHRASTQVYSYVGTRQINPGGNPAMD